MNCMHCISYCPCLIAKDTDLDLKDLNSEILEGINTETRLLYGRKRFLLYCYLGNRINGFRKFKEHRANIFCASGVEESLINTKGQYKQEETPDN